jgi:hypothetical protein
MRHDTTSVSPRKLHGIIEIALSVALLAFLSLSLLSIAREVTIFLITARGATVQTGHPRGTHTRVTMTSYGALGL